MTTRDTLASLKKSISDEREKEAVAAKAAQLKKEWEQASSAKASDFLQPFKKAAGDYLAGLSTLGIEVKEGGGWGFSPQTDSRNENQRTTQASFTCSFPAEVKKELGDYKDNTDLIVLLIARYDFAEGRAENSEFLLAAADSEGQGQVHRDSEQDGYGGTDTTFYSYFSTRSESNGAGLTEAVTGWIAKAAQKSQVLKDTILKAPELPEADFEGEKNKNSWGITMRVDRGSHYSPSGRN